MAVIGGRNFSQPLPAGKSFSLMRMELSGRVRSNTNYGWGRNARLVSDADVIASSLLDGGAFAPCSTATFEPSTASWQDALVQGSPRILRPKPSPSLSGAVHAYDSSRADARPWLYGIATNLLREHRRTEDRRLRAYARFPAETASLNRLGYSRSHYWSTLHAPKAAAGRRPSVRLEPLPDPR
jgi:hypothetical protein